ncbi:hypothetical protein TrCOL_g1242 [Triparma columacea]|uniref:Uncharacterized protein n=1 Tax=Triparma columacea TaxID=722753 RepID=A0A9W7FY17_9STRA|nr:hypothetical protein TrCOL_g1242 [Triparma columacea]
MDSRPLLSPPSPTPFTPSTNPAEDLVRIGQLHGSGKISSSEFDTLLQGTMKRLHSSHPPPAELNFAASAPFPTEPMIRATAVDPTVDMAELRKKMYRANLSFDLKAQREVSCCSDDVEGSIRESYDADDWQQRISEYEFRKVFSEIQVQYTNQDCCTCCPVDARKERVNHVLQKYNNLWYASRGVRFGFVCRTTLNGGEVAWRIVVAITPLA